MQPKNISRRRFVQGAVAGLVAFPVAGLRAADPDPALAPLVSEDDPVALALGYKHDAAAVDTDKYPKRSGDAGKAQFCDNCSLYQAIADEPAGGCTLFPGKRVKAKGWCNSWLAASK